MRLRNGRDARVDCDAPPPRHDLLALQLLYGVLLAAWHCVQAERGHGGMLTGAAAHTAYRPLAAPAHARCGAKQCEGLNGVPLIVLERQEPSHVAPHVGRRCWRRAWLLLWLPPPLGVQMLGCGCWEWAWHPRALRARVAGSRVWQAAACASSPPSATPPPHLHKLRAGWERQCQQGRASYGGCQGRCCCMGGVPAAARVRRRCVVAGGGAAGAERAGFCVRVHTGASSSRQCCRHRHRRAQYWRKLLASWSRPKSWWRGRWWRAAGPCQDSFGADEEQTSLGSSQPPSLGLAFSAFALPPAASCTSIWLSNLQHHHCFWAAFWRRMP